MMLRRIAISEQLFPGVLNIGLMSAEGFGVIIEELRKGRTG